MKKIVFLLSVTILLFSCNNQVNNVKKEEVKSEILTKIANENSKGHILVSSHRCFHVYAPENSIEAVKKGIEIGVDFQEMDVRTTKDSILVLMHDSKIDRTTTGKGKIKDYTYKELQQFNLRIGDSVTVHKIPKLINVLKLLKKSDRSTANLDCKAVDSKQLYTMLKSLNMEHEVISFVGKPIQVFELQDIDSLYATMPLAKTSQMYRIYKSKTKSPLQHFNDKTFSPEMMKMANKDKIYVFVNTLWNQDNDFSKGDYSSLDSVIALKPTFIQTDYPKKLIAYLRSKGLHE